MKQILEFEVQGDYMHIYPTRILYKNIKEIIEKTNSTLILKSSHQFKTQASEYVIDKYFTETVALLETLVNTKFGEKITLEFIPQIPQNSLDEFKENIKILFEPKTSEPKASEGK